MHEFPDRPLAGEWTYLWDATYLKVRQGAVLFEQNDDCQSQHRYMMVEAFSQIDTAQIDPLLSINTQAA